VKELRGRTALLTGASTGIGPYIARRLAGEGIKLILSGRNREALEKLSAELEGSRVLVADLAQRAEVERLARETGDIQILVSNAGVGAGGRIEEVGVEEIDQALDVNLRAGIVLSKLLLPVLKSRGEGHIVFIASLAGKMPAPGTSIYNATKFGLRGYGHALRAEVKADGVGVSLVSPTFVSEAGLFARTGAKASPIAGEVTPDQVAEAVVKAIRNNRAEVDVAPVQAKVGARLAMAAPEVAVAVAGRSGSLPKER
jgi:short-subunit dehydrogenase